MKKKYVWSCVMVPLFAVIFFALNQIVVSFFESSYQVHKVDFEDFSSLGTAYVYMNELEYNLEDNIQELLMCSGWGFAETNIESAETKELRLLFKGKKNTFISEPADMRFSTIEWTQDWKKIFSSNNNFGIYVSTVNLPNDIYDIYVYINENEHNKGIANTGKSFKKEGVRLYEYTAGEIVDIVPPETATQKFSTGWFEISYENGCVRAEGWEAKEQIESEKICYLISYVGDNGKIVTIKVPNIFRMNIAEHLGDVKYMGSGFEGSLSREQLPDESGYIYVLGEYAEQLFVSNGYRYNIAETIQDNVASVILVDSWFAPLAEESVTANQERVVQSDINDISLSEDGKCINIWGWIFAENQNSDMQTVYLEQTNDSGEIVQYYTQSVARADVAEVFENSFYYNSGFTLSIPEKYMADGTWNIKILVQNGDQIWSSVEYIANRQENTIVFGRK